MSTNSPSTVLQAYVDGTRNRDVALLKTIFHDKAIMCGWLGPDFLDGGPEPFYGALEANEVGSDYSANILNVVESDQIASGSITEKNLLGMSFDNHFHMVRLADGTWRITSKLFRHY